MLAAGQIEFVCLSHRALVAAFCCGVSAVALTTATPAFAQATTAPSSTDPAADPLKTDEAATTDARPLSTTTDPIEETATAEGAPQDIVVTGIRSSLANSQNIRRNADTFVDAITAEDIGALPDRSVTEALQRVPGVAISRFAAGNDPDHFSVEGSGVVVRGLNFVRSELNGRDVFSANNGRALGFADVPPELLGSVEVFKNLTADMIEGGLAGTINLNTRVPFDDKKQKVFVSAELNYGDFAKKVTPTVSALYSNQFQTDIGRFGFLGSIAYSKLVSRSDGIQVTNFQTRTDLVPGQTVYAPVGAGVRSQEYDRRRFGIAAAGQWENPNESMLATLQFLRSDASVAWSERVFGAVEDPAGTDFFPAAGTSYGFDEDGLFESGTITQNVGWRSADPVLPTSGAQHVLTSRQVETDTLTTDLGANFKWKVSDRLSLNLDGQFIKASTKNLDFSVYGSTYANTRLDLTGKTPDLEFLAPGGGDAAAYYANPANSFYRAAMDHIEDSDGEELAFRGDATYDFSDEETFFQQVKFGARYADRDQTVRYTAYNWGVLSEVWGGSDGPIRYAEGPPGAFEAFGFGDFYKGGANQPPGNLFFKGDLTNDYANVSNTLIGINNQWVATGGPSGWRPVAQRAGVIAGTPFLPGDIAQTSEQTLGGYGRLDFGSRGIDLFGGIDIAGNVGVRYVKTKLRSVGALTFPSRSQALGADYTDEQLAARNTPGGLCLPAGPGAEAPQICNLNDAQLGQLIAFANGATVPSTVNNKYDHWLPSINVKVGLTRQLLARFAYSKALTRPDLGFVRNFSSIGGEQNTTQNAFDILAGDAANPFLKPVTANQFDASLEWYFARVGSLTASAFYKKLENNFVRGAVTRSLTNNGQTRDVLFTGPTNAASGGNIKGFELAYQQTFDFLPGFLDGLGLNANYTYVKSKGVPNSTLSSGAGDGTAGAVVITGNLPLEGLSKHNLNVQGFYEKGPISLRLAYSWRSKFLLTVRDEVAPFLPTYNDASGQLDGSFFYTLTDQFKVGVQAVNLLNEQTKTLQQVNNQGLLAPRSYFVNDRRFSFLARASF